MSMIEEQAIGAFAALAHENRLTIFQALMRTGEAGMAAGDIALAAGLVMGRPETYAESGSNDRGFDHMLWTLGAGSFGEGVEIVNRKAALRNITLPADVATYIAAKIDSNVRDLEGAITKVDGVANLTNAKIDLKLAKKAIGERTGSATVRQTSIQSILDAISKPAEKTLTWADYRKIFITPERIEAGANFWRENREMLEEISPGNLP